MSGVLHFQNLVQQQKFGTLSLMHFLHDKPEIIGENQVQVLVPGEFSCSAHHSWCWVWRKMIVWVIDIFLSASCLSRHVFLVPPLLLIFILISLWGQKNPQLVCSGIYLSVSLWTRATNGNIPQQLSPWQQDETCCVAYFLSANLQLPSKPLPLRQTGLLHEKLISFTSFPYVPTLPTASC